MTLTLLTKAPLLLLVAALLGAVACRDDGVALDAGMDLPRDGYVDDASDGPPLPSCAAVPDCSSCCTGEFESGALDFTAALQTCACQPQVCASACANTLCGSGLIIDAPCRACLDGARAQGGACHQADVDCMSTQGACGIFEDCLNHCPR